MQETNQAERKMKYTGSFYFFGHYRPAHFEETSLKRLRERMQKAINGIDSEAWHYFAWRIDEAIKQVKKPGCAAFSSEYGAKGISVKKRPHDPFLDEVTATFPHYPNLNYFA